MKRVIIVSDTRKSCIQTQLERQDHKHGGKHCNTCGLRFKCWTKEWIFCKQEPHKEV